MNPIPHPPLSHIHRRRWVLWVLWLLTGGWVDARAADEATRAPAWSVVERGPHHARWEAVSEVEINGVTESFTRAYTELKTGMHFWDEQQARWLEAKEDIEIINGIGVARQSSIQVVFSPDFTDPQGNIELWMPDGQQFRTLVAGIALTDSRSGRSVWIAQPRSSQATLVQRNEMLYADAFEGLQVDVRYTHSAAAFEQDIVLREQPPSPADFGMDEEFTRLEVWTEFFTQSEPTLHRSRFNRSSEESRTIKRSILVP